jgi:hypothetical protein
MDYDFEPSLFSRLCAWQYNTIPLNACPYEMILESSVLQNPWNRFLVAVRNNETQCIFNIVLYCTILVSNDPCLNQLRLKKIHGFVEVWLMALNFQIQLCMALYVLIPPFFYSPHSKKSFAQLGSICFRVSSNTTWYSIVLIHICLSISSTGNDVFSLTYVWIVLWHWKILICIAMYL